MSTSTGDSDRDISAWWKARFALEYSSTWSCGRRSLPKSLKKSRSAVMSFLRAIVVISRAAMLSSAAQARIMSTISVLVRRTTMRRRHGLAEPVLLDEADPLADRRGADPQPFGQRALVEHHGLGRRVDVHPED